MGNPKNYSLELPTRCLTLIETLWPYAEKCMPDDGDSLGPLTSTFLLSMSMPIINVPIERLERRFGRSGNHYADDSSIHGTAAKAFAHVIRNGILKDAAFFNENSWSYTASPSVDNIANGLPEKVAKALESAQAYVDASLLSTNSWHRILRNSLAHGGVAYLDETGRSTHDTPVKMYLFASGVYGKTIRQPPTGVEYLRISEKNYLEFLRGWVKWLKGTGLSRVAQSIEIPSF